MPEACKLLDICTHFYRRNPVHRTMLPPDYETAAFLARTSRLQASYAAILSRHLCAVSCPKENTETNKMNKRGRQNVN